MLIVSSNMSIKICDLKLSEIKVELRKKGLKCTGNKQFLINELKNTLNSSFLQDTDSDTDSYTDALSESTDSVNSLDHTKITPTVKHFPVRDQNRVKNKNKRYFKLLNTIRNLQNKVHHLEVKLTKFIKGKKKNVSKPKMDDPTNKQTNRCKHLSNKISYTTTNPDKNLVSQETCTIDDHKITKTKEEERSKVLVLADSHGRDTVNILQNLLPSVKFCVTTLFKPNATIKNVISNIHQLTSNFTLNDHVIIMAGSNDVLNNTTVDTNFIKNSLDTINHTNTIIVGAFFRQNYFNHNFKTCELNAFFKNISNSLKNSQFIEPNTIINYSDMTSFGLHLNKNGKHKLMKCVANYIHNPTTSHVCLDLNQSDTNFNCININDNFINRKEPLKSTRDTNVSINTSTFNNSLKNQQKNFWNHTKIKKYI